MRTEDLGNSDHPVALPRLRIRNAKHGSFLIEIANDTLRDLRGAEAHQQRHRCSQRSGFALLDARKRHFQPALRLVCGELHLALIAPTDALDVVERIFNEVLPRDRPFQERARSCQRVALVGVSTSGGSTTTYASNLFHPQGLTLDNDNLYLAVPPAGRILKASRAAPGMTQIVAEGLVDGPTSLVSVGSFLYVTTAGAPDVASGSLLRVSK